VTAPAPTATTTLGMAGTEQRLLGSEPRPSDNTQDLRSSFECQHALSKLQ